MKKLLKPSLLLSSLIMASAASAATVKWEAIDGGNNHTYTIVNHGSAISWDDAQAAAIAAGGYLATLTTQAELDFVYNNLANDSDYWNYEWGGAIGPWLGGTDAASEGVWEWAETGETWDNALAASTWEINEPNNLHGIEHYLHFFNVDAHDVAPTWNDSGIENSAIISYIIEIPEVPLPAAAFLLAPALLGFMGLRHKTKTA